jgi:hypothetical protein
MRASLRALRDVLEPTFNIREERENDLGVDGTIEVGRRDAVSSQRSWTNLRAYFQIKHTSAPRFLSDGSLSYPIEVKNLNYLNSRQLPALYVVLDYLANKLYMRWHSHVIQELAARNPNWITQKTVDVHFTQLLTRDLLLGIEAEIRAHAEMVSALYDGPGFIRGFSAERLPDSLIPHYPFVGRQQESATLEDQLTPNSIAVVSGISGSGKTEVVAHLLSDSGAIARINQRRPRPLALLLVDLKPQIGAHSVLRNLAYSLGVSKLSALSEVDWDEIASEEYVKAVLVGQILPDRLRGQSVLAVFENSQGVLGDGVQLLELDQVLASDVFRNGAAIVVSCQEPSLAGQDRRIIKPSVHLKNLSPSEAEALLSEITGDPALAASAVDIIRGIPEVLMPGVIMRGIGVFDRWVSNMETRPAENLAEAIVYAYEPLVRELLADIGREQSIYVDGASGFYTLAVMAFFGQLRITTELLSEAGLHLPSFDPLTEERWIARNDQGYQLTGVAQYIVKNETRLVFIDAKREDDRLVLRAAICRFIDALERTTLEDERSQKAVEESLSWIRQAAPDEVHVQDRLSKLLLPYVVDDLIFPFSKTQSTELRERLQAIEDSGDLESQVAQLVTSSRFEIDAASFLKQFRLAVKLATTSSQLSAHHVRALDIAASIFARHQNLDVEIIEIRQKLITRLLLEATQDNYEDVSWIKWSSSWALNTADLLVRSGRMSQVDRLLEDTAGLLEKLPPPTRQSTILDWNLLWGRLKRLEARVARDQAERVSKLHEAVSYAAEVLTFSKNQEQSTRLYLRAVRRLIEELSTDAERVEHVETALNQLAIYYGERDQWALHVTSESAALIRDEASLHADPERRLERVQSALNLLSPYKANAISLAAQGDTRSLLTLARCYAFSSVSNERLGRAHDALEMLQEAKELCRKAVEHHPSPAAWILLLNLQDQEDHSSFERAFSGVMVSRRSISPTLRKSIKEGRLWAQQALNRGVAEGKLVLWCLEREWISQGSLERHAANMPDLERNWSVLSSSRKAAIVTEIYKERKQRLDDVARRFGVFREHFLVRARNEAQYQRFIALQGDHQFHMSVVLQILQAASAIWPRDAVIVEEEARLHRLVWNYAEAIRSFRRVRTMAGNGEQRREVTAALIETLLSASIHNDVIQFADGISVSSSELIEEAQALLPEVIEFRNVSMEASVLRDRVEFEAGGDIDWSAIDSAYEMVIGGVDAYLETIVRNLDELLLESPDLPKNLAEVVKQNCTNIEVLQGMGSLYLRKAETDRGNTPVQDCKRAYAVFNACRILERSWFDAEQPLTSFRRARTILVAASKSSDPNPFPVYLGKKQTSLDLAESLLQSVISKSVGRFHEIALQQMGDLRALRLRLKLLGVL